MRQKILLSILLLLIAIGINVAYADSHFAERPDVRTFIDKMVKQHHFKKQQLITLFSAVKLRPQVVKSVKKPLEKELWNTYQMLFVNEWRITHGVEFWNKYATALHQAEKTFNVPASIIVATIGIETKYGTRLGEYRVIDSLTNLAFSDSSRANFFRKELEEFLILSRDEHLDPLKVMGSYAGAIGQPQFMPSTYRHYAVNFSKSGKTDLMNNEVDVIGSIANYYKRYGWRMKEPVVIQATVVSSKRYQYLMEMSKPNQAFSLPELEKYGILPKTAVSPPNLKVKIVELPTRYSKEYWLEFHNFGVIKRYNRSDLYAMAIYELSQYIEALRNRLNNGS